MELGQNLEVEVASVSTGRGTFHISWLARAAPPTYSCYMAQANCPDCGGTGWKTVEAEGAARTAVRCDCSAGDRTARILGRARIPRRYEHCDFANFDIDLYENETNGAAWDRSLKQAKVVVQGFARDYPVGIEYGLLLMGPCGVGKTHLGVAALKEVVLRGHSGLFYDYRELLKEIQASYNPESQSTEMEVLEPVLTAEVLLLDDLGASKPSPWALDTLSHILNTRYNEKRVTLITTNYLDASAPQLAAVQPPSGQGVLTPPFAGQIARIYEAARLPSGQGVPTSQDDTLADRVGQRIRSRLYEMCRTVDILAPDYRREVRQAGRFRS